MPATAVADGSGLPNENTRRLRVLVAAYNPISRKLYRHALEADGYEVVECVDGGAALEASARQRPDLVIQELLLADGSGFELARRLRDLHSGVPIVGITGVAPVPAELFDDVLVKPVGPQRLVETVRALAPGQRPARTERGAGPPARPATGGAQDARRESLEGVLLSFAAALSDSFATSLDAELSLDDVLRALADATEIDRSAVFLSGDAGARVAASCGFRATEREMLDRLCAEGGLVDRCLAARKVLPVEDGLGLRSGRVAPLGSNARSAGAILLGSETLELGAEWDLFARGVGSHLGEALATSRLLARVAASEERYRSLLENANDGIVVLGSDGRVIEVNHRAEEMLGRPRTELIGNSLAHVAAPVARVVERLILERTLRSESVVIDLPAGGSVTMELSARIVETRAGRQAIAIARDVSERSRLESQLHQAQKMEAVGRLTGGIAHDFNNVLAIILAHASFLLGDLPADDPRHADAKEIRQAAERAAALTRQLLAFSRKQVLEPVVLDMNVHVAEMAKLLPRVLGPSIELATALSADLGSVRVDPIQLEQVVMNLAINAKDAMPAGGRLLLETSNAELDEGFSQTHPVTPGPYVLLCVSDTGVGMDAETQRHLFEPFFTTKERGKGTGLGLSTCYGIVKQSGGYIWAYSEVGSGTTFKIYLPRVGDPPGAPAAAALLHTLAGTEKVLVVDDDEKVRALASRILKTHGYHVLEAEDVAPAIGRSADESGTIDLLVADVLMPGGSGLDLALRLRASRPHMRVLLISGYTEQGLPRERMLEIRAAFLQKPFSPDALARKVREVLDA